MRHSNKRVDPNKGAGRNVSFDTYICTQDLMRKYVLYSLTYLWSKICILFVDKQMDIDFVYLLEFDKKEAYFG